MTPPLITLEEHYVSKHVKGAREKYHSFRESVASKLDGLGDERIKDMDAGSVALQIISHGPTEGSASTEECRAANDELAQACREQPKRYAGFAMLPMAEPQAAMDELERCVKELNFVGALVNNHINGTFYDGEEFWPIFEKAVELDVPIYIHPTFPSHDMLGHYKGNYSDATAFNLSIASWGWHTETGLHFLRLFASGLFDKLPTLKIIIGHMGEMLPFAFDRIQFIGQAWQHQRTRSLKTVWDENLWITTSGYFSLPPMSCLLQTTKIDKILYSVDYPFASNEQGLAFVEKLQQSKLVDDEQLNMICYKNAEKLLKVKAEA